MSTSNILLDQNYNANDVDIMAFEPCVLFPACGRLGGAWPLISNEFVLKIHATMFAIDRVMDICYDPYMSHACSFSC